MSKSFWSLDVTKSFLGGLLIVLFCLNFIFLSPVLAEQNEETATPAPIVELTLTWQVETVQETPGSPLTPTPIPEITMALETITDLPQPSFREAIPTGTPLTPTENFIPPTSVVPVPSVILIGEYAPTEVLVRFRNFSTEENRLRCLSASKAEMINSIENLNVWLVQVPFGQVAESIAAFSRCPEVRYAEPNYAVSISETVPGDPDWVLQYGLISLRAPQGWDYSTGSEAVTIAILDTGVDLNHLDLAGKIVPGYDFVNHDALAQDDNGHGTHVAGIAAASGNNGIGVVGVSWGARIMPVKVLNAGGNGSFATLAEGIAWAADHGAQIVNLSLGGASPSAVLEEAVNYAVGKGVVLVAAAGNTGSNFVLYPARYPNVIAVGAVDAANNRMGISNYGPELDLVAPGASIYSTLIGGYGYKGGTSMAAPYVSGLAAILYGMNSSPAAITAEMETTTLDLGAAGFDVYYGFGLIQMDRALRLALPPTATATASATPSVTPSVTPTPASLIALAVADQLDRPGKSVGGGGVPLQTSATSVNLPRRGTPTASPTSTLTRLPLPPALSETVFPKLPAASSALPLRSRPSLGFTTLFILLLLLAAFGLFWSRPRRSH